MGVWYFLILFIGIFLVYKGVRRNRRISLILIGTVCIGFSLFMFAPGSAEVIAEMFQLD